jgi:hypothetical protein
MDLAAALALSLIKYHATRVPEHMRGETEPERVARITLIAEKVVEACEIEKFPKGFGWTKLGCVVLEATAIKWESGLLREVHSGEKLGPGGEVCLNQLHRTVVMISDQRHAITADELAASVGLGPEPTLQCLRLGVRVLGLHVRRHRILMEKGGYWSASLVFREYHRPTTTGIDPPVFYAPSPMDVKRGMSFQLLYRQLAQATKAK